MSACTFINNLAKFAEIQINGVKRMFSQSPNQRGSSNRRARRSPYNGLAQHGWNLPTTSPQQSYDTCGIIYDPALVYPASKSNSPAETKCKGLGTACANLETRPTSTYSLPDKLLDPPNASYPYVAEAQSDSSCHVSKDTPSAQSTDKS